LTRIIFSALTLKPLASMRAMIVPVRPRRTPSGLTMAKVCSTAMGADCTTVSGYARGGDRAQDPRAGGAAVPRHERADHRRRARDGRGRVARGRGDVAPAAHQPLAAA